MKQYVISINDEEKAKQLLALLSDLTYVQIVESPVSKEDAVPEKKRFLLMDNPIHVENVKHYTREELYSDRIPL